MGFYRVKIRSFSDTFSLDLHMIENGGVYDELKDMKAKGTGSRENCTFFSTSRHHTHTLYMLSLEKSHVKLELMEKVFILNVICFNPCAMYNFV